MPSARTPQQKRHYLMQFPAFVAAIFLVSTNCAAQAKPGTRAAQQSKDPVVAQDLSAYPGLIPEFGQLFVKLEKNVPYPGPRAESRLLPLLPESTVFFAAFPNYGDAAHQALQIFRQELQESSVLRDWWGHGDMATAGSKLEDSLEKFYQLHQYLGEEIVVSGSMEGQEPTFLAFAEVRKPGLKKFLEEIAAKAGGESGAGVRVLDAQGLALEKEKSPNQPLLVLVRNDFVIAAEKPALLRSFIARLDGRSQDFLSTPFGHRVTQEYRGGLTILAGVDLQRIMAQASLTTKQDAAFQRSGFADMKYLIWEHKGEGAQAASQAELSFTGPRRGSAAWLGKSRPLPSLDFVSPKALAAITLVLSNPAQIFDDLKQLAGPSSDQFRAIAGGEQALNLSLKDDLLSHLGGEFTAELDNINPPRPTWRAIFQVKDANHIQQTLNTLLTAIQVQTGQTESEGITYRIVQIPASQPAMEIAYAFTDGYLIVGSSRETVAESVRLHSSGGSLAKSPAFQASHPPGHSMDASALFYEDPVAMAALQMRRFAPQMAESLSQTSATITPSVVCLYGDETAIREASSSGGVDIAGVLIVAAVAIPNLLRSKIAANEASAVGSIRTVNTAQIVYETTYPKKGFAPSLAILGVDPRRPKDFSPEHAGLLDETLAKESCTGDAWCTKSGYQFRVTGICSQRVCTDYVIVATPVQASTTGVRSFCSTSEGIIRFKTAPPLASPVTLSDCKSWQTIP
jgi:type IV pilus assembly protein PilA